MTSPTFVCLLSRWKINVQNGFNEATGLRIVVAERREELSAYLREVRVSIERPKIIIPRDRTWHKITVVGSAIDVDVTYIKFRSILQLSHAGKPRGGGLFKTEPRFDENVKDMVVFMYFSPAASVIYTEVLDAYHGVPSERPDPDSVAVLAGFDDALYTPDEEF